MKQQQIMKSINNMIKRRTALVLMMSLFGSSACSSDSNNQIDNSSNAKYSIPDGVVGIVLIESPTMGSLLQLRGIVGKGILVTKQINKQTCLVSRLRLAAGDFGGSNVSVHSSDPIHLNIYSQEVVEKLSSGVEIISEDYSITENFEDGIGDIQIISGLNLSHGFVLNPGEWSWSTIFGVNKKEVSC